MNLRRILATSTAVLTLGALTVPAVAAEKPASNVVVATFNASLNRESEGELLKDLAAPGNQQANNAAETIQRINPDIVLVNEFDYDAEHKAMDLFRKNYLEVSINGSTPVTYPYAWTGPVNTGVDSGYDLDHNGKLGEPSDGWGYGKFPGQYGFVVYSKYPIDANSVRTFQNFLWKDMPGNNLPVAEDGTPWYSDEILEKFPLSSKTHADIPVNINGTTVHVLADHPTPPIDGNGPERRNSRRNFDEIRIWADYISGKADYLYDNAGVKGGLADGANFVIVGDHNSDPNDGNSWPGAIQQLLDNPRVVDTKPSSEGGLREAELQGGVNREHKSDPQLDTADFAEEKGPGNLRVDYVLPNSGTDVLDSRVFWPTRDNEHFRLTGLHPFPTSDHRLVWAKLHFPGMPAEETPAEKPVQKEAKPGELANTGISGFLPVAALAIGLIGAGLITARKRS